MKPHKVVLDDAELETLESYNTHNKISFTEMSSLTAQGIFDVFKWITEDVVEAAKMGEGGAGDGG